jgi:putative glycosyltransferase
MKLSIVATLYQSAPYVVEFVQRAEAAAKALVGDEYESVLVNDGSPDNSLELAVGLCELNSRLIVVDLSRNFGHHKAMMTGLAHAKGKLVFLIDSDLEEEPEWLEAFAKQMKQDRCDVVYGVQKRRKGNWIMDCRKVRKNSTNYFLWVGI